MGIPLYRTIFETLQDEIRGGRYQDAFPSEAQLIRRFAVGRHTILRVIRDLVEAGLIERRRGSGSVVSRRVRQKLGDIGLILPTLTSTPFTNALAAACKEAGYALRFHELGDGRPMVNYAIARHLIERGAKKIAVNFRKKYAPSVMERMHGVAMAVSEAGLGWDMSKNVFYCCVDDEDGIAKALRKYRADAIVCGNDIYAALLLNTLRKLGVSVPGDIRVTGMDDVSFAALLSPALTTIRQDFAQIARIAAERIVWRIRNPNEPPVTIQIPGELVIREST